MRALGLPLPAHPQLRQVRQQLLSTLTQRTFKHSLPLALALLMLLARQRQTRTQHCRDPPPWAVGCCPSPAAYAARLQAAAAATVAAGLVGGS